MNGWRAWIDRGLATLFEPPCAACGTALASPLGGAVCEGCWSRVERFTPPVCRSCGLPLASWRAASLQNSRCARCRRRPPPLSRQAAVGPHTGSLREIVHALKYDARRSTVGALGSLMRAAGSEVLAGANAVVPVPLHARRGWSRGFNQAAMLAAQLGPPVEPLLRRTRATPPQVATPAGQRQANVRDAFVCRTPALARLVQRDATALDRVIVVLVDDVCTTGATLDACARPLIEAGVGEVRALTVSRVVPERLA